MVHGGDLSSHIDSWYAASTPPQPLRRALEGDVEADACVIGGGIAGCSTALHLAERGYRVVLLEAHRVALSRRDAVQHAHGVRGQEQRAQAQRHAQRRAADAQRRLCAAHREADELRAILSIGTKAAAFIKSSWL